jgi:thiamine-monophosphate kinase
VPLAGSLRSPALRFARDSTEKEAALRLRDLGEFELIARIERAARRMTRAPGVGLGIGDDAALLRARPGETWAVSTDARIEGVHFRFRTETPRTVGETALAAALSDLAAMGARPRGFTCALAAPGDLPLAAFDGLVRGLVDAARRHDCPLVGGNLARASETSLVTTVFGGIAQGRALRRRARPGDRILVTGELGAAALARARAERRGTTIRRIPVPRLAQGRALARIPAITGCIDISDGFTADLAHLLGPRLRCAVDPARLPVSRGFAAGCRALGLDPIATALTGGDDYELLFAVGPGGPPAAALSRRLRIRVTELGRVESGPPKAARSGFDHFADPDREPCT